MRRIFTRRSIACLIWPPMFTGPRRRGLPIPSRRARAISPRMKLRKRRIQTSPRTISWASRAARSRRAFLHVIVSLSQREPANRSGSLAWRAPSLCDRAFNDMPLDPLAVVAMKGSQVLAGMARLDCRQFHRRSASGALRSLVLSVEHMSPSWASASADIERQYRTLSRR
jgi:hypothetical protein